MLHPKRNDRPILLNLAVDLLEEIDVAVREQGVTRTHFLREAAERNLRHYCRVERPYYKLMQQKGLS